MKNNDERLSDILTCLDSISYIKLEKIPEIDLYMDQVTSFMEEHLKKVKRSPEDKALTKTMINNYAKNNLPPPPVRKKYTEYILLLLFIYYYKNLLSFHDIEQLLRPITEEHFGTGAELPLGRIYQEVFDLEDSQMDHPKEDIQTKFEASRTTFQDAEGEDREYLQLFAFISELSFDIYMKKQMVEMLIDQLHQEDAESGGKKRR